MLAYESPSTTPIESDPGAKASAICGVLLLFVPFLTGIIAVALGVNCLRGSTPLRALDRVLAWIGVSFGTLNLLGSAVLIYLAIADW